jgi:hypothetical protein
MLVMSVLHDAHLSVFAMAPRVYGLLKKLMVLSSTCQTGVFIVKEQQKYLKG